MPAVRGRHAGSIRTILLLAVLLALPLALYSWRALSGYGTAVLPHDLLVFLGAADDVLAGRSPFPAVTLTNDSSYVYPPLLALAVIPLAVLPTALAILFWTVLASVAVAAALWLLDVRDWRVYGVGLLWPATHHAVTGGTIGPLLLLGTALAWRYRDRGPGMSGTTTGLAVALKLFVWPLIVWWAATRRVRTALLALAVGTCAALASWMVIGFRGLRDYPDVLRRLSKLEAEESYSAVAVGRAIGLPSSLAVALSLALGGCLLVLAIHAGRDERQTASERDRLSLTAALAASLAFTPILWSHYLILLLVPLALARPRLSPLWLVPLLPLVPKAGGWLPAGWPSGDPAALAVVLVPTVLVLAMTLRPRAPTALLARDGAVTAAHAGTASPAAPDPTQTR